MEMTTCKERSLTCEDAAVPLLHHVPGHLLPGDVLGGAGQFGHHHQPLLPSLGVGPLDEGGDGGGEGGDVAGGPAQGVGGAPQQPLQGDRR